MNWAAILFGLIAAILTAGAGMCVYEAYAIATNKTPVISRVVAYVFATNPHAYVIGIFIAGVILGALVTHFTNWTAA